jgi:hypothetical protein
MKPGGWMSRSSKRVKPGCPAAESRRRSGLAAAECNRSSMRRERANDGGGRRGPRSRRAVGLGDVAGGRRTHRDRVFASPTGKSRVVLNPLLIGGAVFESETPQPQPGTTDPGPSPEPETPEPGDDNGDSEEESEGGAYGRRTSDRENDQRPPGGGLCHKSTPWTDRRRSCREARPQPRCS